MDRGGGIRYVLEQFWALLAISLLTADTCYLG